MKRATNSIASPAILVLAIVFLFSLKAIATGNVTYDHRSLSIGGRRQLIISAAIHYPRSVPAVSDWLLFLFFLLKYLILSLLMPKFEAFFRFVLYAYTVLIVLSLVCTFKRIKLRAFDRIWVELLAMIVVWFGKCLSWEFLLLIEVDFILQMWPSLVQTAKEGGCNAIESYVFWNGHEPSPGKVSVFVELCVHHQILFANQDPVFVVWFVVLFWWTVWYSEVHQDCSASWNAYDRAYWPFCCCWVELRVMIFLQHLSL